MDLEQPAAFDLGPGDGLTRAVRRRHAVHATMMATAMLLPLALYVNYWMNTEPYMWVLRLAEPVALPCYFVGLLGVFFGWAAFGLVAGERRAPDRLRGLLLCSQWMLLAPVALSLRFRGMAVLVALVACGLAMKWQMWRESLLGVPRGPQEPSAQRGNPSV